MKLCGVWEAVFPFRLEKGEPQAHSMVFFMLGHCHDASQIELSRDLDAAAWVNQDEVELITGMKPASAMAGKMDRRLYGWETSSGNTAATTFPLRLVQGEYPNRLGQGFGEAHLWMLQEWCSKRWYNHTYTFD